MRWEMMTDFRSEFIRPIGLRIPGEYVYRHYLKTVRKKKCVIPEARNGVANFMFQVFSTYQLRLRQSEEQWELFRFAKDLFLARYIRNKEEPDPQDKLLVFFWRAQRILSPGAVRLFGKTADPLLQDYEESRELFDRPDGIKIVAAD